MLCPDTGQPTESLCHPSTAICHEASQFNRPQFGLHITTWAINVDAAGLEPATTTQFPALVLRWEPRRNGKYIEDSSVDRVVLKSRPTEPSTRHAAFYRSVA